MVSLLFAFALWSASAPAFACSCGGGLLGSAPADDGLVPLDAALLLAWGSDAETVYELVEEGSGAVFPVAVETWTEAETVWHRLVPDEPLLPASDYLIRVVSGAPYAYMTDPDAVLRFHTGDLETHDAPPDVTVVELQADYSEAGNDCGEGGRVWSRLRLGQHDADVNLETDLSRTEDFAEVERITDGTDDFLWLGASTCQTNVASLVEGEKVWVRTRAVTLSGVAGPWSEPERIKVTGGGFLGCSQTGLGPSAWWLVPVLFGLSRRRRA